jgi:Spy/CpxP family protein refolding chaperone
VKNPLLLVLAVVVLLAAVLLVGRPPVSRTMPIKGYLDLISLSDEQKQKVEVIRKDFLPKVSQIRQELRTKRLQLNDMIFSTEPDVEAIDDKTKEIADLQAKLEKEVIDHILQEKEILTIDQQRQFREIIKKEFEKGGLGVHGERGRPD